MLNVEKYETIELVEIHRFVPRGTLYHAVGTCADDDNG